MAAWSALETELVATRLAETELDGIGCITKPLEANETSASMMAKDVSTAQKPRGAPGTELKVACVTFTPYALQVASRRR